MRNREDRTSNGKFQRISVLMLAIVVTVIMVTSTLAMPSESALVTEITTDIETPDYYVINNTLWDDLDLIDFGPIIIPVYFSLPMVEVRAPAHDFYMIVLVNSSLLHSCSDQR